MPSRRALITALGTGVAALAGCAEAPNGTVTGTDEPGPSGNKNNRPTASPRDPDQLDATGDWALRQADAANTGTTILSGVAEDGTDYWHLRRLDSGPAVVADGQLFHLAELGQNPDRRTRTTTMTEGGTYIVRDGDPYLVARDARTGELNWHVGLDGPAVGWPACSDDTVVAGVNGQLLATDPAGEVLWENDMGEAVVRDPSIVDGTVYVPTNSDVRAYDLADGSEQWTVETPDYADGLAVAGGAVYVTTAAATAHAFEAETGEVRWRTGTVGEASFPPTVVDETLYVGGSAGVVAAHSTVDGGFRWHRELGSNGHGGVAVTERTVLYAGEGALHALARQDGTTRWRHEIADNHPVTPSVANGVVYGGARGPYEPELYALDLGSGEQRWSVTLPRTTVEGDIIDGGLEAPPAVVDGGLYVYAVDGLYAIGPN